MLFLSVTTETIPFWVWLIPAGILIPEAVWDIKNKTVCVIPVIIGSIAGIIINIFLGTDPLNIVLGLVPGLLLILVSLIFKDCIGKGDGEILIMIGFFVGLAGAFSVLFTALIIAMFFCLVLLLTKKAGRKSRIPFVPFILAGLCVTGGIKFIC